ncbi:hypothetical protein IQ251_10320 [Saccharopolyspora sp. HNM0983]|uniref:Uncharacterized protein n=1 Tax=Saccharopolyspora montiporae TaxID=2781240 RepID=A0A929B9N9_9PSEU|nr:hypothetical protein [Saccharopolyspora sp. HNM0983]MBE9374836.1 hypothetical protein [Saccharopolyspora sp. HNM0983]
MPAHPVRCNDDGARTIDDTATHRDDAALIWAEATVRDGDTGIAALEHARPVIEAALVKTRSFLLIALDPDDRAIGLTATEPSPAADSRTADLRFRATGPAESVPRY